MSFLNFVSDIILDLLPSTPFAFLVYLGVITLFSVLTIFYFAKKKSKKSKKQDKKDDKLTVDSLLKIAANPKSSPKDLLSALMAYNEKFRVKDDIEKSLAFFRYVLNHKNRKKAFFDYFHRKILPKNTKFEDELNEIEKEALKLRDKLNSIS